MEFKALRVRKPSAIFRCPKTGRLWFRSILDLSPDVSGDDLEKIDSTRLNEESHPGHRQRIELLNEDLFTQALWAEEHTAQLAPRENRRLQDLFKAGLRNVLSSSTTLELGIDIGGLSGVLLGNVPPGRANYLQRAGRAGRRADGSSIVVTYVRPRPFDRAVFREFGAFLEKPLRKPVVLLNRGRIARRHLHAFLLGEFFRTVYADGTHVGAMNAFGKMGPFCEMPLPGYWDKGKKPPLSSDEGDGLKEDFRRYLQGLADSDGDSIKAAVQAIAEGTEFHAIMESRDEWRRFLDDALALFDRIIADWKADYRELLTTWEGIEDGETSARSFANRIRYQLSSLYELTVIETLADRQFLPRYGFPIGVLALRVFGPDDRTGKSRQEDQYRLERPGLLALREYVPGSELTVGGRVVKVSRAA